MGLGNRQSLRTLDLASRDDPFVVVDFLHQLLVSLHKLDHLWVEVEEVPLNLTLYYKLLVVEVVHVIDLFQYLVLLIDHLVTLSIGELSILFSNELIDAPLLVDVWLRELLRKLIFNSRDPIEDLAFLPQFGNLMGELLELSNLGPSPVVHFLLTEIAQVNSMQFLSQPEHVGFLESIELVRVLFVVKLEVEQVVIQFDVVRRLALGGMKAVLDVNAVVEEDLLVAKHCFLSVLQVLLLLSALLSEPSRH